MPRAYRLQKVYQAQRTEDGLCYRCGRRTERAGRCRECLRKHRQAMRRYRK